MRAERNTLPSAKERAAAANQCADKLERHPESVTSVFRSQVLRECAEAAAELVRIEAEIAGLTEQLGALRRARLDIEEVRDFVKNAFNDGKQIAPITGVVANHAANPGQSVTAGTSIIKIYDPTDLYVQWVLSA